MRVWRIVKAKRAASAFDGKGASAYPGRWNSEGTPVVYTALTSSLCCLEIVVSATYSDLLQHYVIIPAEVPDDLVMELAEQEWPPGWNDPVAGPATRAIGDAWARSLASAGLLVPSALALERNVILNPAHPRFNEVEIGDPQPFPIDARLAQGRRS